MLDQLAVPADRASFAALAAGIRCVPGTALPAPAGIFPRHVETEPA